MNNKNLMISFAFIAMAATIDANPKIEGFKATFAALSHSWSMITARSTALQIMVLTKMPTIETFATVGIATTGLAYTGYNTLKDDETRSKIQADIARAASSIKAQTAKLIDSSDSTKK